jgi:O-acetyl-ADP-ribose deacetylase (regulator of RNase III)
MPFYLIRGDLVAMNVDCIVNAANINLKMVEGVGRAIFHKAGDALLKNACNKIKFCPVGQAVETPSFGITNTKLLIHAIGPNYINGKHGEEKNLIGAYESSFKIMKSHDFTSIAFPLLSGENNYPLTDCYEVAYKEIVKHLKKYPEDKVYLVIYKNFPKVLDDKTYTKLSNFIEMTFKVGSEQSKAEAPKDNTNILSFVEEKLLKEKVDLNDFLFRANATEVYFDKLKSDSSSIPSKSVMIGFAISLKLSAEETVEFLKLGGYKLQYSNFLDLIVAFFIKEEVWDVFKINEALFTYNIVPVGCDY